MKYFTAFSIHCLRIETTEIIVLHDFALFHQNSTLKQAMKLPLEETFMDILGLKPAMAPRR